MSPSLLQCGTQKVHTFSGHAQTRTIRPLSRNRATKTRLPLSSIRCGASSTLDGESQGAQAEVGVTPGQLLRFGLPTLTLPLSDPVMSLIDVVCISRFGSTLELAAAGPASLLFGAASSLFSAVSATALADVSAARADGREDDAREAFGSALRAAIIAGTSVAVVFASTATLLVQSLGVAAEVVPTAASYLTIRSFAAPAWMISAVCSAVLLAQHDSRSPSVVVLLSAVFNLVADIVLIAVFKMGLTGAAIATVATQYLAGTALLFVCLRPGRLHPSFSHKKPPADGPDKAPEDVPSTPDGVSAKAAEGLEAPKGIKELATEPPPEASPVVDPEHTEVSDGKPAAAGSAASGGKTVDLKAEEEETQSLREATAAFRTTSAGPSPSVGSVSGSFDDVLFPDESVAQRDATSSLDTGSGSGGGSGTLLIIYAAKLGCYYAVQCAAMRLGVVELAAHNALFSLWNVAAFFPVPLQTTALAFVPSAKSARDRQRVTSLLLRAAVMLAVPLALACAAVPTFSPQTLAGAGEVAASLPPLALVAAGSIFFCTVDVACEGVLVARKMLRRLLYSMIGAFSLVGIYFWQLPSSSSLRSVWLGLVIFFGSRAMVSVGSVLLYLMSKRRQQAQDTSSPLPAT